MEEIKCKKCGRNFIPKSYNHIYCSQCSYKRKLERNKEYYKRHPPQKYKYIPLNIEDISEDIDLIEKEKKIRSTWLVPITRMEMKEL